MNMGGPPLGMVTPQHSPGVEGKGQGRDASAQRVVGQNRGGGRPCW